MVVRLAQFADAPEIAKIHVETWRAAYRGQIPDAVLNTFSVERRLSLWNQLLAEKRHTVFVAELEKMVVGFCDLAPSRDKDADAKIIAEIVAIYVSPLHWRKRAGRALCEAAISEMRRAGYQEVTLWVLESNSIAKRFYETMEFHADGTHKTERTSDGSILREVRFRMSI